jgi:hypothetical protein
MLSRHPPGPTGATEEVAELLSVSGRQVDDWLGIFRHEGLDKLCTLNDAGDPCRLRPADHLPAESASRQRGEPVESVREA